VIISRVAELRRLYDLLTALIRGEGGALIVHGDAGIGKTTLLEALAERSAGAVTVVRACGAETEMELTFSALADLLDPVLGHLDALPVPQAAALMGALALEPPTPGDRLAVCVAALGVLRAAARCRPVLAIIDDLQWVDPSSRECIEYIARRADGPLAVVLAARDPLYPPERIRLPGLPVGPVDDAAAAELLRHRAPGLAPPVVAAITQAAAGNPLALVELPAALTAARRRAAHAALAAVLSDGDDRRAWHLAAAVIEPDEDVAAALERVGRHAITRRAYAAGAGALERAARLTPGPGAASRRLIMAGQAAAGAGLADRALALLAEAAEVTGDAVQRAAAQQFRGRTLVWRGRGAEATPLLVEQASRVAPQSPVLAAVMLSDAANGATGINSYIEAEQLARRAAGLLGDAGDPAVRGAVLTMRGWTLVLRGRAPEARPVLAEAFRLADEVDPLGPDWPWLHILLRTLIPLGEFEQARDKNAELCRRARDAGALAILCSARLVVADAAFRLSDWEAADAAARQTLQLAGDVGHRHMAGWALTVRTRILAAQGRPEESRAAAATAMAIAESDRISTGLRFVHGALGFLELGLDRVDAAISELETVERLTEGSGHEEPVIVPWVQDLVEAYARQGRRDDARRVLARLERQAASTAIPVAAAAACSTTTLNRPSPARSRRTTGGRCRSSGHAPCWPSGAGYTGPAAAPRPASGYGRPWRASSGCTRTPGPARPRPSCAPREPAAGGSGTSMPSRRRSCAWPRRCSAAHPTATSRPTCSCPPRRSSSTCARSTASWTSTPGRSLSRRSRTPTGRLKPGNSPGAPGTGRTLRSRGISPSS
jgi:tetratricopeptide (TPR) repeat protein